MTASEFLAAIDARPGASDREVRAIESWLGGSLPADYRAFLMRANGGWKRDDVELVRETGGPIRLGGGMIGGAHDEGEGSIRRRTDDLRAADVGIPPDMIWIMDDGCGGFVLLGVAGAARGRVYYCDHEILGPDGAAVIEPIAESFGGFLARLGKPRPRPWWRWRGV